MRLLNLFFVFLLAPIIGLLIALANFNGNTQALALPLTTVEPALTKTEDRLTDLQRNISIVNHRLEEQEKQYKEQQTILQELANKSHEHKQASDQIYEQRILTMLGPPVEEHRSQRVEVKVFKLDELGYRGFIAKVKLFDPSTFKVVLAKDRLGEKETPSQAATRTGAVLGINGGGFYNFTQNGRQYTYPIGNVVINGKLIGEFQPTNENIFFAGIRQDGKLVGGLFSDKQTLMALKPWQGTSFVPILIQNGKPLPLPQQWQNTRHPRTIIGEYANGDLILIVVDGRQGDWSSGVTLERLQIKLIELGVKEGYNLDGGGSSTFIFNNKVLNRPSDGVQRAMATNIVIMP